MKNNIKDVINTLQIIYNSTFMPIHLFENGKCISSMPVSELPEDFIITYRNRLVLGKKSLHYFSTKEFLLVGIIKSDTNDLDIVMGPVSTTALSEADIDSLIASYSLPVDYKEQIWDFYDRTPRFTMSQFLNIMTLINKELNGNIIDVFEYLVLPIRQKNRASENIIPTLS